LKKGFPVLICGTTDSKKKFHPYSLTICSKETHEDYAFIFNAIKNAAKKFHSFEYRPNILIADAAPAITNGFKAAFDYENDEEFYRVTCWAHVERKCEEKTNCLPQPTRDELLLDIKNMQAMPSTSSFNKAVELFMVKWGDNVDVSKFLSYFKEECLDKNRST
jgi:hypothetical protein